VSPASSVAPQTTQARPQPVDRSIVSHPGGLQRGYPVGNRLERAA
jgi:hypothetical protein